jgi:hypothetical protein
MSKSRIAATLFVAAFGVLAFAAGPASAADGLGPLQPRIAKAVAADTSPALRDMKPIVRPPDFALREMPARPGGPVGDERHDADGALQSSGGSSSGAGTLGGPLFTFEGPSNEANFSIFGFRVNPPDPVGDVGRYQYVAMVNLVFSVYSKAGALLAGPIDTGSLWQDFPVTDCTDPSGDPIVVFDDKAKRWILTQFTTRGTDNTFYNCVAVSVTEDATGAYHRFAFSTGPNFPDYPKYGVWPNADEGGWLAITTREFDPSDNESIGIYAVERAGLLAGDPNTSVVSFNFDSPFNLVGDGVLPADQDGNRPPPEGSPQLIVGTQDDGAPDGATFDALNVFELNANFGNPAASTFFLKTQLPTQPFDSIFPCSPTSRDCLPQPGIVNPDQYLDILSYRQRPTWRLQYRNFGTYEALATNQSVEATPGVAGVRWYELRNPASPAIYQQGTFAPGDGVHRWMGSVAMDKDGNLAVGYSVVNGTTVFPGIRYTGRLSGDPLGQLTQTEQVLQAGTGVQTTTNSRWGDYTSMNVDPKDGCTFYYMNEYYRVSGVPLPPPPGGDTRPWKTRIGAFKFPGCK